MSGEKTRDLTISFKQTSFDAGAELISKGKAYISRISAGTDSIERTIDETLSEIRLKFKPLNESELVEFHFPKLDNDSFLHSLNNSQNSLTITLKNDLNGPFHLSSDTRTPEHDSDSILQQFKKNLEMRESTNEKRSSNLLLFKPQPTVNPRPALVRTGQSANNLLINNPEKPNAVAKK